VRRAVSSWKRSRLSLLGISALSVLLAGCVTTPRFSDRESLTVARLSRHIQCEIYDAAVEYKRLYNEKWVAVLVLTLQVDEDANLVPSLTHILPLLGGQLFTFGYAAKFDTSSQRIYTENLTVEVNKLVNEVRNNNFCADEKRFDIDLAGDLGIKEIVGMGFSTAALTTYHPQIGGGKDKSAFGESVQFIVTKNMNGVGPTWTLTHFKGPGGLLTASRTTTNKLVISFAPPPDSTSPYFFTRRGGASAAGSAAAAAMANNLLLLEQGLPSSIARQIQQLQ